MLKYVAGALLAGAALFPAAASAQDRAPFTGPRVEGIIGYDRVSSGDDSDNVTQTPRDDSIDGLAYGVGAGFDFDLGGVVVGVEGSYVESEAKQQFGETLNGTQFLGNIEVGRDIYLGARIGYAVTPRTLIYAKGGYTNTKIESAFTSASDNVDFDTTVDGWRVGGGVEQMLGRNFYLKGEYTYSNYNGLSFDDDLFGNEDVDIDLDRHQLTASLGVRF